MAVLLCKRWEDALMAYAIKEWVKRSETEIGRTIVQKIAYFLKAKGLPMNYEFDIYHYGPYSQELYTRMEDMVADGVVMDKSANASRSIYLPGPQLEEIINYFAIDLEEYKSEIIDVMGAFAGLKPNQLELMATIHYFYVAMKRFYGTGPTKDVVVDRVFRVKGEKFSSQVVSEIYDLMEKAGLLVWEPDTKLNDSKLTANGV